MKSFECGAMVQLRIIEINMDDAERQFRNNKQCSLFPNVLRTDFHISWNDCTVTWVTEAVYRKRNRTRN